MSPNLLSLNFGEGVVHMYETKPAKYQSNLGGGGVDSNCTNTQTPYREYSHSALRKQCDTRMCICHYYYPWIALAAVTGADFMSSSD